MVVAKRSQPLVRSRKAEVLRGPRTKLSKTEAECAKLCALLERACVAQSGRWNRMSSGTWNSVLGCAVVDQDEGLLIALACHESVCIFQSTTGVPEAVRRLLMRDMVLKVSVGDAVRHVLSSTGLKISPYRDVLSLPACHEMSLERIVDRTLEASIGSNPGVDLLAYAAFRLFPAVSQLREFHGPAKSSFERPHGHFNQPPLITQRRPVSSAQSSSDWLKREIAARPIVHPLTPSKRLVYEAVVWQRHSVAKVAADNAIQESTVIGYVTSAVAAGHAYDWDDLKIRIIGSSTADLISQAFADGLSPTTVKRKLQNVDWSHIQLVQAHCMRVMQKPAPDSNAATRTGSTPTTLKDNIVGAIRIFFV